MGQLVFSSQEDVNQPEMIHEAVKEALEHAGMTIDDVDCIVHGNMELFEMVHQPDLWHTLGSGAYGKETMRVTTGAPPAPPSAAQRIIWSLPASTMWCWPLDLKPRKATPLAVSPIWPIRCGPGSCRPGL
ncbi:MAG: hypothetical protein R2860_14460 [Desulfobacterales bacterium]